MIIDFHTHLYRDLESQLEKSGVDKAIVMLHPKRNIYTPKERIIYMTKEEISNGNEEVINASKVINKYIPFAWLNYKILNVTEKLEDYVQRGCKGLKLQPVLDHYNLLNPKLEPLINTATHLKIPIMIHVGWRPSGSVEDVGKLAEIYTDARFVASHMIEEWGVNRRLSHIKVAQEYDNIWLETSYAIHPRRIAEAVKNYSLADRILFGSDYPMGAKNISWDMTKVTWAEISEEDKQKILGENAEKLLNL